MDEAIQAWLSAVQQTALRPCTEGLMSVISTDAFQGGFRAILERATSSPSGSHYTLWKALAKEDNFATWLSIMMSFLFMHGFTNLQWTKLVDVMLEKKRGVWKIHLLCIICILETDFKTVLKILFTRKLMALAEGTGDLNEE